MPGGSRPPTTLARAGAEHVSERPRARGLQPPHAAAPARGLPRREVDAPRHPAGRVDLDLDLVAAGRSRASSANVTDSSRSASGNGSSTSLRARPDRRLDRRRPPRPGAIEVACSRERALAVRASRSSSRERPNPRARATPIGSVSMRSRMSSIGVEREVVAPPAGFLVPRRVDAERRWAAARSCPSAGWGRCARPPSSAAASRATAASAWSGGLALTFQSAPTCTCAASLWFCSTIARYEVASTSRPIDSSSSSAAAKPVPGDRPSTPPREVGGQPPGRADALVELAKHEREQAQRDERRGEQQQGRRGQDERLDRVLAGLRFRAAAELQEREDAERQHDQLDRHAREERPVLARGPAALLDHRARDRGHREREQHRRRRRGRPRARATSAPSLNRAGNTTPGSCSPLKRPASLARPSPRSNPIG